METLTVRFTQCPSCQIRIPIVANDLKATGKTLREHAQLHENPEEVERTLTERAMLTIIYKEAP